jgi:acetyltransferase-like isoleucine patch superfamily enzyme
MRLLRSALDDQPYLVSGPRSRLKVHPTAWLNDAYLNVGSGTITVDEWAGIAARVSLLTGTHDFSKRDLARQTTVPTEGRDIRICRGAWIACDVTIIGPCTIGEHSVVGAGSVVTKDVPPYTFVAGVPAVAKARVP